MTTWAIGDIQGCSDTFFRLLAKIDFSPSRDSLWVAGDMVNRGPNNLDVLRYIKALGSSGKVVLGNHDLHLLAASVGARKLSHKDTLHDVLVADDCDEILRWLRHQPLLITDKVLSEHGNSSKFYCMSHAGVPMIWSLKQAQTYAKEVHQCLKNEDSATAFFYGMYGNTPDCWYENLKAIDRLRVITNYLTRMRFISDNGTLDLASKEGAASRPSGFAPWFEYPRDDHYDLEHWHFLFGHWAALEGYTGKSRFHALDTGCVWGGTLTVMNLTTQEKVSISA